MLKQLIRLKQLFKSKKAKPIKWLLYAVTGFVFLVLFSLILIYFLLKSGSLTEKGVLNAKPYLTPFGIDLVRLDSLRLDAFKSISLRNLHVKWTDASMGAVGIKLGQMDAAYSFSQILDGKLEISQLNIEDISLDGKLTLVTTPTNEPEPSPPMSLSDIEEILTLPPLMLDVKNFAIKNVDINMAIEQDGTSIVFTNKLNLLEADVTFNDQQLAVHYLINMESADGAVQATTQVDEVKTIVKLNPSLIMSGGWNLTNKNKKWNLVDFGLNNDFQLKDVLVEQVIDGVNMPVVEMKAMKFNLASILSPTANTGNLVGIEGLFPLSVKNNLNMDWDKLESRKLTLDDTRLSLLLDHSLNVTSEIHIDKSFEITNGFDLGLKQSLGLNSLDLKLANDNINADKIETYFSLLLNGTRNVNSTDFAFDAGFDFTSSPITYVQKVAGSKVAEAVSTNVGLTPNFKFNAHGKTAFNNDLTAIDVDKVMADTNLNLTQSLRVDDLSVNENSKKIVSINNTSINVVAKKDGEAIRSEVTFIAKKIDVDGFKKKFSIDNAITLNSDEKLSDGEVSIISKINKKKLFKSDVNFTNKANIFSINHKIELEMIPGLDKIIPDLKEVYAVGSYAVNTKGFLTLKHTKSTILNVDFEKVDDLDVATGGRVVVSQIRVPKDKSILMKGPLEIKYDVTQNNSYVINVDVNSSGIKLDPLLAPIPVRLQSKMAFDWPLSTFSSKGGIKISRDPMLSYDLDLKNKKNTFIAKGNFVINANPNWDKYIAELSDLRSLGEFEVNMNLNAALSHDKNTILELDGEKLEEVKLNLGLDTEIAQRNIPEDSLLMLKSPVVISQKINWQLDKVDLNTDFEFSELLVSGLSQISLQGSLGVVADNGLNPNSIDVDFGLKNGKVALSGVEDEKTFTDLGSVITPTSLQLSVKGLVEEKVVLEKMNFSLGDQLVSLTASGNASMDGKNAQLESLFSFTPRENMLKSPLLSGTGELSLPLSFSMLNGEQVSLNGAINFKEFTFKTDDFSLLNTNGNIVYEEELRLNNDNLSYAYLMQANPFQRVDFGRIQPFLDVPAISIQKIQAGEIEAGPLLANISLTQNLMRLQQFDVKLFDGNVVGQFYLDTTPGSWKVGVLSRMTGVDLRKMFPANTYVQATEYSPINMRVAFEFDVHEKLVEGRIDISKIKRDQLLQLLEFVDPDHLDAQLSSLRSALGLAHPDSVKIEMLQGLMNLEVSLSALPKPIRISGIPLSVMMQQFSSEMLEVEKQFPIH